MQGTTSGSRHHPWGRREETSSSHERANPEDRTSLRICGRSFTPSPIIPRLFGKSVCAPTIHRDNSPVVPIPHFSHLSGLFAVLRSAGDLDAGCRRAFPNPVQGLHEISGLDVARRALDPDTPIDFAVSYSKELDAAVAGPYFAAMPGWTPRTFAGLQAGSRANVVEIITHPLWNVDPSRFGPQLAAAHAKAVAAGNQVRFKSHFEVLRKSF